ncbi:unnamed protein product [Euphydryas editha]|uniref:Uncharacterized protein n=1 Tax=Euphydryas editha TaxID=104508 RepID=A0AAU9UA18_EUPED|nr:unnamed protein product [Euphydryas editha]
MAESNDVQTLEKISTEVDESQFKIILSSQCIKAQSYLVDKLRKQSEQQTQVCNFISNGNLKLETEIKIAEQEVKSLQNALDTIKTANVDLKKELLVAKEKKLAIIERVNNGIKKYKELWTASKKRYESIPFIQHYLQTKDKCKTLQDNILKLTNETQKLRNDINIRKRELIILDRKYIIELANFMVHERPQILQHIQEKSSKVVELLNDIQKITKEYNTISKIVVKSTPITLNENNKNKEMSVLIEDSWPNLTTNIDNAMLPKLQLRNIDLDILSIKLNQIKKVDSQNAFKRTESEQTLVSEPIPIKKIRSDETVKDVYTSSYFESPKKIITDIQTTECHRKSYSEKKLIHILEDIKLDSVETNNIVSNVEPSSLKNVDVINADVQKETINSKKYIQQEVNAPKENENIEVTDFNKNQSQSIIIPPTQFLDLSPNSQERKDTFDTVVSFRSANIVIDLEKSQEDENDIKDNKNNQLNISTASEDSYIKIKEIIFKKHNLDLSPQFTYTKNSSISMRPETHTVTSKFFLEKSTDNIFDNTNKVQVMEIEDHPVEKDSQHLEDQDVKNDEAKSTMNNQNTIDKAQKDIPVAGFLFTHGPQGIPDSLNISTSTTGYDEADTDYPTCIDSSLLLSPKADIQLPDTNDNNQQVLSQEVPNFLSGIRKTGFSFFAKSSTENRSDTSEQNQNGNFTFSFGGNEKKNRGGFFSMFH